MSTAKTAADKQTEINDLDPALTIPVSVRVPARVAFQLYLYAARMNTSAGKLLTSLLEDTLPAFKESKNFEVTVRVPQVYRAMEHANLLMSVNPEELKERMLQRAEGSGPMGRPRKVREQRGTEGE
ncbi:MAG: hypothetical protein WB586_22085 [Chthoniobacterales bacterium]